MIETLERDVVLELCRRLGHDPERVARIVIEPDTIEVVYYHPVVETAVEKV